MKNLLFRAASAAATLGVAVICSTAQAGAIQPAKANVATTAGWTRVTLPFLPVPGDEAPVLTVPIDAKKFYLRQSFSDRYQFFSRSEGNFVLPTTGCSIFANGAFAALLLSNATDLRIPFTAGDVLTVRCDESGMGFGRTVFVFSD